MARKLKSPSRRFSNAGARPRFVGFWHCHKADPGTLPADSIAARDCGLAMEWRSEVVRLEFEPEPFQFEPIAQLPAHLWIPDYRTILDSGEFELVEAKSSLSGLRDKEREALELRAAHCSRRGITFRVVYHDELKRDGFIDTLILLRPYGWLPLSAVSEGAAMAALADLGKAYIEEWRVRAVKAGIPITVLYHLLYRQRLPLLYRPLLHTSLQKCRI